jgi:hypothetical protein
VQLLATGIAPEIVLPLEERNLVVTSDEGDDVGGTISIFQGQRGLYRPPSYRPVLRSRGLSDPWAALSGLAADRSNSHILYAVPDNALVSSIFRINVGGSTARIREEAPITRGGEPATYDLEGITVDTTWSGRLYRGFWLCSEGNAARGEEDFQPNLLIQVDRRGRVLREIGLPESVDPPVIGEEEEDAGLIRSNGFEGVAVSQTGRYLVAAIQRGYAGEPAVGGVKYTRIARYDLLRREWEFFLYPLDETNQDPDLGDWIGLSEIVHVGFDVYAVIERDKMIGSLAEVKRIYVFWLGNVSPFDGILTDQTTSEELHGAVIRKVLYADIVEEFAPFEKIEGLAITRDREVWAALDNDGGEVESRLVRLRRWLNR